MPYVDVHETHTGVVVLAGDRAYKAKKPVLTDFLDFRTPEQRERACLREVELNSRLSPGSYLGVAHLDDPAGGPAEPIVVMRRYRENDRLASMVTRGESVESVQLYWTPSPACWRAFIERAERSRLIDDQGNGGCDRPTLAREPVGTPPLCGDGDFGGLGRVDRADSSTVPPNSFRAVHFFSRAGSKRAALSTATATCSPTISSAWTANWLCSTAWSSTTNSATSTASMTPRSSRWTWSSWAAKTLVTTSSSATSAHSADSAPSSLRDFYIAYRAVVRAKVDCVRLSQGKSEAAVDAARHLAIAAQHLESGAIRLALIGGNPGTGKSTLARALAERVGAQVISTDDVRRELRDSGAITGDAGVLNAGLYSPDNVEIVYEVALRRARDVFERWAISDPRRHLAGSANCAQTLIALPPKHIRH